MTVSKAQRMDMVKSNSIEMRYCIDNPAMLDTAQLGTLPPSKALRAAE